jgi:hypothetical protein
MYRKFTIPFGSVYGKGAISSLYKNVFVLLLTYPFLGKVSTKGTDGVKVQTCKVVLSNTSYL